MSDFKEQIKVNSETMERLNAINYAYEKQRKKIRITR